MDGVLLPAYLGPACVADLQLQQLPRVAQRFAPSVAKLCQVHGVRTSLGWGGLELNEAKMRKDDCPDGDAAKDPCPWTVNLLASLTYLTLTQIINGRKFIDEQPKGNE